MRNWTKPEHSDNNSDGRYSHTNTKCFVLLRDLCSAHLPIYIHVPNARRTDDVQTQFKL